MLQEGFYPTKATQSASRHEERKAFAKHLVRFRHRNYHEQDGGLFPELVLVNSHDGMSSYRLMAGLYRQVCTNGMVAGKKYNEVRVRHQGDVIRNVIEGTYQVVESSHRMLDAVEQKEGIQLTNEEQQEKLNFFEQQLQSTKITPTFKPTVLLNLLGLNYSVVESVEIFSRIEIAALHAWTKAIDSEVLLGTIPLSFRLIAYRENLPTVIEMIKQDSLHFDIKADGCLIAASAETLTLQPM